MYIKIIISLLISIFIFSGCEISNLNNKINSPQMTTSDIKQLVGVSYDDIEKIYGSPEQATYYINKNNLKNMKSNYISLRNFNYYSIIKSYYSINDDYLILWYKNNKVINAFFNEKDMINKNDISMEISNKDIKLNYFKNSSSLKNKIDFKNHIGNNINYFKINYNLSCPKISVDILNKNKKLYFYNFSNNNNTSLFIIVNSQSITFIDIIKTSQICETILEYI